MALSHAAKPGHPVIPVYIVSEWSGIHHWTGPNRQHFLCGSIEDLANSLESIQGRLIIRKGDAITELEALIHETGATAVHLNADPDPFGKSVEESLLVLCRKLGVECNIHADATLHGPHEVLTQEEKPYRVFTPYCKNWTSLPKPSPLSKPKSLDTPAGIKSLPLPSVRSWGLEDPTAEIVLPGESHARQRLTQAISRKIGKYSDSRDLPAEEGTSRISQDLRHGLVSIRTIYAETSKARSNTTAEGKSSIDVFIKELAWREFYFAILHHFPNVLEEEFNPDWRGLPWDEPGEKFEAWKSGSTGFPIVDAGMRQLEATGFMHNRVRMITAMFLTKDLHIDWRLGESWFMQKLVDGEIASNNGGWQWSAGTGADAAPYFRIQNPWTQTSRYDADGSYIKKWVPELAKTDAKLFLSPPKNGSPIASGYPLPIVDHHQERDRTLTVFKRHREKTR